MNRRVAAVDCGTNSVRLLVADVDPVAGTLTGLERRLEIVRLGQGVDRTGRIAPESLARTLAVLDDYAKLAAHHGVTRTRMVATSATRDADNRDEFVQGALDTLGVRPEVATGAEEAHLSFVGATRELPGSGLAGLAKPYLMVDIGGGSTEFVLGSEGVEASYSVDVGVVRLTERHLHDDPPTAEQVRAALADVDAALDEVGTAVPLDRAATLVGVAGTVTTVSGMALDLPAYEPSRIHHSRIAAGKVREITERMLSSGHSERAAIPVIHPGRVDVIGAGSLLLNRIMERLGHDEVIVSEHDILDGIAWSLA